MGKIINALRVAQDEVAELVLPQIDDQPDGALELEPIQAVDPSTDTDDVYTPLVDPIVEEEPDEHERRLSLCVSEMWPLLSSREDRNAAEQYRLIRTKIIQHSLAPSMIVVSSPGSGDGKTVTAVNLAAALASRSEEQVLLVDADLRRSAIHSYLHAPEAPGLSDVLAGTCEFEDAILSIEQVPNLYVLTAGNPVGNPTELLDSSAWLDLTKKLRQDFRRVVVDSPPVGMVADYDVLAAACDGVILVVRPDHTSRKLCMGALKKINKKLIGVLLNATDNWFLWRQYSHEYYLSVRDWKKGID